MIATTRRPAVRTATALLMLTLLPIPASSQEPPPLPTDLPVMLLGDPRTDASRVRPYEAVFAMGRATKDGPLATGEAIQAGAYQTFRLERTELDGRPVIARHFEVRRPGADEVLASGAIHVDATTLAPLRSRVQQGPMTIETEYDWEAFEVRVTMPEGAEGPPPMSADLQMFEAAVHDVWMAALPLEEGFAARIPVMLAGPGGDKFWAVPRVVGSEAFDVGDGVAREAWVVELEWWGMGASEAGYFPGGGVNGTAGSGGKYWVLKEAPAGMPRVVRIRTEVDETSDSIVQLQAIPPS